MKYNARAEKCATCDYWGGDRDTTDTGYYVVADPNDQGSCNVEGSSSRRLDNKSAQWSCPNWSKWGALRG